MAVREGRWDCQYCGATGILGRHKVCPNCAHSRPEGTKFYLPEDEEAITDAKLQQQAKAGADWICEYCRSSNPAGADVCYHCNAPREGTSPQQEVKEYAPDAVPRSGDMDLDAPPPPRPKAAPAPKKRSWTLPVIGGIVLLLLVCVAGAALLFGGSDADVTVTGVSWERTVTVEKLQTVTEEDWEVPDGGRVVDEREEIHHYDQVLLRYETRQRQVEERVQVGERTYVCGQRDMGNGFFEDIECTEPVYETQTRTETYEEPIYNQVPVYDTMYTYEIDKWVETRTERAGGDDRQTFWPELNLAENEREGERTETYTVTFVDGEGEEYEMEFSEAEWLGYERGGKYKLKVNALGNPVEVVK